MVAGGAAFAQLHEENSGKVEKPCFAGNRFLERQLGHGKPYLLGSELTLADFYLLPSTFALSLTEEGKSMYQKFPRFSHWREMMEALPTVRKLCAALPPRAPIEHAREWATSHRPKY